MARIDGSASDDVLRGTRRDDRIFGLGDDDRLFGRRGDDVLNGGDDDDRLVGSAGRDTLWGGDDNDRLDGGRGGDRLVGGDDDDLFVFGSGYGRDVIVDFHPEDGTDDDDDPSLGTAAVVVDLADDRLDLRGVDGLSRFAQLRDAARQHGDDLVLRFGDDRLVIENFRFAELDPIDVLL